GAPANGAFPGPPGSAGGAPTGGFGPARAAGGGGFGGDSSATGAAVAYAKAHGGGTIVVSSQSGASGSIIRSGANVAAIGGFSGRESSVSLSWFVEMVRAGKIRWVVADANSGPRLTGDTRTGSLSVMEAVMKVGKKVTTS